MSYVSTFALALLFAIAVVAADWMTKYSEENLQQILKTVLKARPSAPLLAFQLLVFLDSPCERPLKARFFNLYCNKIYMEYHNFC